MDHVVGHLVRRGIEAHSSYRVSSVDTDGGSPVFNLPPWGAALLACTVIFFVAISSVVGTFGVDYE